MTKFIEMALAEWLTHHTSDVTYDNITEFGAWLQRHTNELLNDYAFALDHPTTLDWGTPPVHTYELGTEDEGYGD